MNAPQAEAAEPRAVWAAALSLAWESQACLSPGGVGLQAEPPGPRPPRPAALLSPLRRWPEVMDARSSEPQVNAHSSCTRGRIPEYSISQIKPCSLLLLLIRTQGYFSIEFRESGSEGEREREIKRHQCIDKLVASHRKPNLGWGLNPQFIGVQTDILTTALTSQGRA